MNVYQVRYDRFDADTVTEVTEYVLALTLAQVANHFYEELKSLDDRDLTGIQYVCTISQRLEEVAI